MTIFAVRNLTVRFHTDHGVVHAVEDVSFELEAGETLGLVGESGSGKSVTCLAAMGLVASPPGVVSGTEVRLRHRNLLDLDPESLRRIRGREISMIFQDPMTSLNPLLTIGRQLTEVLETHEGVPRKEARRRAARGLGDVGIPAPEARLDSYPHELSGGMRQRVMIAMALLCQPEVLFADEPTTALDVTIQAQILDLLRDLQERHGMAMVLITHDLGVVAGMADRIHVMYAGRLIETGDTRPVFRQPLHPYTSGLLDSVPSLTGDPNAPMHSIEGQPPDLTALPRGCSFAPRCPRVLDRCGDEVPPLDGISGSPQMESDPRQRRSACFEAVTILEEATPEDAGGTE